MHGKSAPLNGAVIVSLCTAIRAQGHTLYLSLLYEFASGGVEDVDPVCLRDDNDDLSAAGWGVGEWFG